MNRNNVRIWGKEKPREIFQHERDSLKLNVWCGLLTDEVLGPYFFEGATVSQTKFHQFLVDHIIPDIRNRQPTIFLQLDGAPVYWGLRVRETLNAVFPGR